MKLSFFLISFCLIFLISCDLIPSRYPGKRQGDPAAPIMIEMHGDLLCPACAEAWPTMKEVLVHYGDKVVFYFHTFPLPYHTASFHVSQASNVIVKLSNNTLTYFWRYLDDLYIQSLQQQYWNDKIATLTDTEVVDEIAKYISSNYPFSYTDVINGMQDENINMDTRVAWKFACARGIYGTPMFYINGMLCSDIGSGSTLQDWEKLIDGLLA
ncbi:hypothetical protein M0813_01694 [Anaeramoeba flamelloides]|uniref:Thioredoxin-like fold domain-containing protein n=1 Tax=Anaeramoeba flamelloides TaxID=1746091 RepID=A0ABQ8YWV0_9EUKA|nr:hypothetical protein M0813_01694 [Anaeramoeba flamelloides]